VLRINGALILEKKMNKISREKKQAFLFCGIVLKHVLYYEFKSSLDEL
jgi:hypothetical protein